MKLAKYMLLPILLASVFACSPDSGDIEATNVKALKENTEWPYEMIGVLEIVDAGGYQGESDYPTWAVGMLNTGNPDDEIAIDIQGDVAEKAGVNIDSGEKVKVWLNPPPPEPEYAGYQVIKIESL